MHCNTARPVSFAIVLTVLLTTATISPANDLTNGSFDALPVGSAPDDDTPAGAWFVPLNDQFANSEGPDPNVFSIVATNSFEPGGSGNSFRVHSSNVDLNAHVTNQFENVARTEVTLAFDAFVPQGGAGHVYMALNDLGRRGPNISFQNDSQISVRSLPGPGQPRVTTVAGSFEFDQWQRFELRTDLFENRFDLYSGPRGGELELVASGLGFFGGQGPALNRVGFAHFGAAPPESNAANIYFDNVSVTQPAAGHLVKTTLESSALAGNPNGDPATRDAMVYLPPGYEDNPDKRYPVVYMLPGTGGDETAFLTPGRADLFMDRGVQKGFLKEMILVNVDPTTKHGSSFYTNSELTGNHEDYFVEDLVKHIDSEFRTIASKDSRGIFGQSTGGYAGLLYGMKHSDTFGAVYTASAGGLCWSQEVCGIDLSGDKAVFGDALKTLFGEDLVDKLAAVDGFEDFDPANTPFPDLGLIQEVFSLAAAFSPDVENQPLGVQLPFELPSLEIVPEVRDQWLEHDLFRLLENDEFRQGLRDLNALYMDVGDQDEFGLLDESQAFSELLDAAGIEHTLDIFEGGHFDQVGQQVRSSLGFFSQTLVVPEPTSSLLLMLGGITMIAQIRRRKRSGE